MNTKIYLGMASGKEREQPSTTPYTTYPRKRTSLLRLDVGEAIVTSTSLGFPVPIRIPFIDEIKRVDVPRRLDRVKN